MRIHTLGSGVALGFGLLAGLASVPARADFDSCLAGLQGQAASAGVSAQTFQAATRGISFDDKVIELSQAQPSSRRRFGLHGGARRRRAGRGRARPCGSTHPAWPRPNRATGSTATRSRRSGASNRISQDLGKMPLVQSAGDARLLEQPPPGLLPRRADRDPADHERGDIAPERLTGSWAGAFGQTQFMPTTYHRLAVDGDGDGRRDVVDSVADAVGSTANFLRVAKWQNGQVWGYEVKLPRGFSVGAAGRKNKKPIAHWASLGVTRSTAAPLSGEGPAASSHPPPASTGRPSWSPRTSTRSIRTTRPNPTASPSRSCPTASAARPASRPPGPPTIRPCRGPSGATSRPGWPPAATMSASRTARSARRPRDAIKDVERKLGMTPTGRPGGKVLEALRGS